MGYTTTPRRKYKQAGQNWCLPLALGRPLRYNAAAARRLAKRRRGYETTLVSFMEMSIWQTNVMVAVLAVMTIAFDALAEESASQTDAPLKKQ
ncbi:MAG: hypothetical protein HZC54_14290 [Verrucomicrobia bacterium]|nr:hypothetical protein [Verrucomicrobiota bacterium]